MTGLHGIDYLALSSVAKNASYVFAHGFYFFSLLLLLFAFPSHIHTNHPPHQPPPVIDMLIDIGYDENNLVASSYDWRLPPQKLQERDNYFGRMKKTIEGIVEHLGKEVRKGEEFFFFFSTP